MTPTPKPRKARAALAFQCGGIPDDPGFYVSAVDRLADPATSSPLDALVVSEESDRLRAVLGRLDPRHRRVIELRFGLDGRPPMKLREIGLQLRISRERVRQVELKAMRRLREILVPREVA
jgi:RNA polymerase primary sigma factor